MVALILQNDSANFRRAFTLLNIYIYSTPLVGCRLIDIIYTRTRALNQSCIARFSSFTALIFNIIYSALLVAAALY